MSFATLSFLMVASVFLGIMTILRKEYQRLNGLSLAATVLFTCVISVIGGLLGIALNGGIHFDAMGLLFGLVYAVISMATTSICIYATAFGSVSTLLLWAMLGSLVLPSAFGLITQPAENSLTGYKVIGFLMAAVCMAINFCGKSDKKESINFKLLCGTVFLTNGSALVIFNLKTRYCAVLGNFEFIAYYMLFSVAISSVILLMLYWKDKSVSSGIKKAVSRRTVLVMVSYAVLFLSSEILVLKCAGLIPLIMQAPVSFCIPIITTALIDFAVYKVKLNKTVVFQMLFAAACCVSFMLEN